MEEETRWNHLRYHFPNCSNLLRESMERKTPSRFLQYFEFRSGNLRKFPYHGRDRLVQTIKFQNWQQSSRQSSLCKLAVQASNSAGYSSSFRFDLKTSFGLQHYHSLKNPCYASLSDCLFSDISLFFFYLVDSVRFLLNSTSIVWCFFFHSATTCKVELLYYQPLFDLYLQGNISILLILLLLMSSYCKQIEH